MVKIKLRKKLGTGFIIVALFFLFNPDIAIIDVLPDVIGYCFMLIGLSSLAEINDKIHDARLYFGKAAICNLVKLFLIVVLFGLVTPREMPVSLLLFSFVMSLFDLIFLIPAYRNLFGGLLYLGERLDGSFALSTKKKSKKSVTEKAGTFTLIFVVFKAVSPVLPEMTSLIDSQSSSLVNYYDFIGLYRMFAIAVVLVIGIAWLVSMVKYFAGIRHDKTFMNALTEKYRVEVMPRKSYFMKKFALRITALLTVASALTIHLYFDSYNIIPGLISAVLFIIAASSLREYSKKYSKLILLTSVGYALLSTAFEILRIIFFRNYIPEQIQRNPSAYDSWQILLWFSVAEAVFVSLTIIFVLLTARNITKKYTGYYSTGIDSFDPAEATRELHSELCRPMILTAILGILSSFTSVFYIYGLSTGIEAIWLIGVVIGGVFAVRVYINIKEITNQINYIHFLGE